MKGTARPSDALRAPKRLISEAKTVPPKHGQRFGDLAIEGVPFSDDKRRLRVHVRCVKCRAIRSILVYHLLASLHPRCHECVGRRWNRAPVVMRRPGGKA